MLSRPGRRHTCSVLQSGARGRAGRPRQRWVFGPAGSAGGARAGSSLAAGSEREAGVAGVRCPAGSRRLSRGAMEELDGEPTVTVRRPQRVLLALAVQGLSQLVTAGLSTSLPPARCPALFSQLNCPRPEVPLTRCRCSSRRGRWVSAPLYTSNTWPQRPRSVPLRPLSFSLPTSLAFPVGRMLE